VVLSALGVKLAVAGIVGVGRSWTAWMISLLSIPRRYAEVIPRSASPSWRWIARSGTPSLDISMAGDWQGRAVSKPRV
jgi:hypothetical protein